MSKLCCGLSDTVTRGIVRKLALWALPALAAFAVVALIAGIVVDVFFPNPERL